MAYDLLHLDPAEYAARLAAVRRDGAPAEFVAALERLRIITDPDWIAELVFAAYERGRRHYAAQNIVRAPALARARRGVAKLNAALGALGAYHVDIGGPLGALEVAGIAQHCRPHVASDPADIDGVVRILEGEIARLMADATALSRQWRPKTRLRCFVDGLVPLHAILRSDRKRGLTDFIRASCALVVEEIPSPTLIHSTVVKVTK